MIYAAVIHIAAALLYAAGTVFYKFALAALALAGM